MYYQQLYELWAPPTSVWTPWVKPVLFAQLQSEPVSHQPVLWSEVNVDWAPRPGDGSVIIIDLPGAESVMAGVALVARGFRPVPLFNCCMGPLPVVNVRPIVDAFDAGAETLMAARLPDDAPPAFLLDSRRSQGDVAPQPGKFDNRWVVLPQDFPSANLLMSMGYRQAVLVQQGRENPRDDLAHVLRRWQEAGMSVAAVDMARDAQAVQIGPPPLRPITVGRPRWFRNMWYTALAIGGLRRSAAGGFGALIPFPSESSGGGRFG